VHVLPLKLSAKIIERPTCCACEPPRSATPTSSRRPTACRPRCGVAVDDVFALLRADARHHNRRLSEGGPAGRRRIRHRRRIALGSAAREREKPEIGSARL